MPLPVNMAALLSAIGHFGWIPPAQRTQSQQDAHARAVAAMPKLNQVNPTLVNTLATFPKGAKVMLTDFWRTPEVVADLGKEFTGFGQKTGSCVGVSEGNAVTTTVCRQRTLSVN